MTRRASGQIRATSVDDTAQLVDETGIVDVTRGGEISQFLHEIEIPLIVGWVVLNFLSPVEESRDPLQVRMFNTVTDFVGGFAEVDVGK